MTSNSLSQLSSADRILTPLGREQARATGRRLRELGLHFDRLIYSTKPRATETAKLIMEELGTERTGKVVSESMLEEGRPCQTDPPSANQFLECEVFEDGSRIEAGFRRYFRRQELPPRTKNTATYELVVGHANVSRYYVMRALQLPPEAWLRLNKANGSITWIVLTPSGHVYMRCFGEHLHLPPDLVTYT